MRIDYKRIKDVFPDYLTAGLFKALATAGVPWSEDVAYLPLDILYVENHSGDKIISPMVLKRLDDDGEIDSTNMAVLAGVLKAYYGEKWIRLWEVVDSEYSPLENYDMIENGTDIRKNTGTDTNVKTGSLDRSGAVTKSGSETVADDIEYKGKSDNIRTGSIEDAGTQADNATDSTNKIYGYNSSAGVNSDSSNTQEKHKNTQTFNSVKDETSFTNRKDERDITTTYNNVADTDTRKDTYNNIQDQRTLNTTDRLEHQLRRHGNIGVTTSQQMAQSQIELWRWLYFEEVMQDIDKLLTLPIY